MVSTVERRQVRWEGFEELATLDFFLPRLSTPDEVTGSRCCPSRGFAIVPGTLYHNSGSLSRRRLVPSRGMPLVRCQVRQRYFSDLPADIITNTIYFWSPTSPVPTGDLDEMRDRIHDAYQFIDNYMPTLLQSPGAIRYYDMSQPEPRVPIREDTLTLTYVGTTSLPLETSLVLSFRGEYDSGTPNARRRGRLYLGPWTTAAAQVSSASEFPRPAAVAITAVQNFARALAQPLTTASVEWHVRSETTGGSVPVLRAWVNNEWDTQRRRGVDPTSRNEIDPYTGP